VTLRRGPIAAALGAVGVALVLGWWSAPGTGPALAPAPVPVPVPVPVPEDAAATRIGGIDPADVSAPAPDAPPVAEAELQAAVDDLRVRFDSLRALKAKRGHCIDQGLDQFLSLTNGLLVREQDGRATLDAREVESVRAWADQVDQMVATYESLGERCK
jgi:hypothetical protein